MKLGVVAYVLMLAGGVAAFAVIRHYGETLTAPEPPPGAVSLAAPKAGQVDVVAHVLAALAAVVCLGFLLGRAFRLVGQPPVIGEVIAGIMLGPSLLGAVWPEAMHFLIPGPDADPKGQVTAALKAIAQLGVILYMFLVGLELNPAKVGRRMFSTVAVAHGGIVATFALSLGLAVWLFPTLAPPGVPFDHFALVFAVAMSITAFPVLARILADRKLDKTDIGLTGLSCAAVDDATAWCLLAAAVGVVQSRTTGAVAVTVGAMAFILAMVFVVRPVAVWAARKCEGDQLPAGALPLVFVAVLVSALVTESIGIHAVFGAFLLGAILPHNSKLAHEVTRRLHDSVTLLFLPAFFAYTGMRTQIGLLSGWESWLMCAVIVLVATLGKFGGTFAAARLAGHSPRDSAALGAMMNTRGLMGLIVLDIGLTLGVISPALFAMMVLMALATTMMTAPALARVWPQQPA